LIGAEADSATTPALRIPETEYSPCRDEGAMGGAEAFAEFALAPVCVISFSVRLSRL
jgi:hypothetical protein